MALLMMDGFDCYGSFADMIATGTWLVGNSAPVADTTGGRFGGGSMKMPGVVAGTQYVSLVQAFNTNATYFISFNLKTEALPASGAYSVFGLFNPTNSRLFTVNLASSGALYVTDAAGAQDTSGTTGAISTSYRRVEIKFNAGTSTSTGSLEIKVDGVVVVSLTGKNYYSATGGAQMRFFGIAYNGRPAIWFDDLVVNDTTGSANNDYLGDIRIDTMRPFGDTEQADFALSGGADGSALIRDTIHAPDGDASYIQTSTPGAKSEFDLTNIIGSSDIYGVQARTCCEKTDAGPRTYRAYIKSGEAVADGLELALPTNYAWASNGIWETDPDTLDVWNEVGLNNLKLGFELVS